MLAVDTLHTAMGEIRFEESAARGRSFSEAELTAEIVTNYVDSHGQSEIGFAFCELLGYRLLPRLKRIGAQRLYRPETGTANKWQSLAPVLSRPINWDLIAEQYDQMIRYTTAIRLGTADTEQILRRFTPNEHPAPDLPGARRTRQSLPHRVRL